jgi:hypothetical protein
LRWPLLKERSEVYFHDLAVRDGHQFERGEHDPQVNVSNQIVKILTILQLEKLASPVGQCFLLLGASRELCDLIFSRHPAPRDAMLKADETVPPVELYYNFGLL